ncbi:hypothetical protein DAETH_24550 [Deinococcus aetherius]|uniref:Uncharacterized protein n=1 Tax=Deinococcus aetherius TaxID=200252 RepID=A0ABM8AFQ5_9DEIO|nr:hypothetical protein [Deinococcus aetherius]BDP42486.1 hypothetical protein DAETH_24550 [Deinococcus aetherius]
MFNIRGDGYEISLVVEDLQRAFEDASAVDFHVRIKVRRHGTDTRYDFNVDDPLQNDGRMRSGKVLLGVRHDHLRGLSTGDPPAGRIGADFDWGVPSGLV